MADLETDVRDIIRNAREAGGRYASADTGNTGLNMVFDGIEQALVRLASEIEEIKKSRSA
jgi:hypothetical protein